MSNSSKLSLVLAEVDSVQFFTDAATGRSGISQSGLAALCGVTKQALSKLTKSLSTKCPSIWLKPIQGQVDDLSTRTETGILLYYDQLALAIIKHYAFSGREQAQLVLDKFALIGFNAWVQRMTGWQEPEKPTLNADTTCVLDLLEAHTRRSESLNRTIHTAIHQQINAIKDTLKVLEGRLESSETITIEAVKTTTPQKNEETTQVAVRRLKGEGSGSIHWRTYTRNGRQYRQAFFHYELWEGGDRLIKSCKYIRFGEGSRHPRPANPEGFYCRDFAGVELVGLADSDLRLVCGRCLGVLNIFRGLDTMAENLYFSLRCVDDLLGKALSLMTEVTIDNYY